MIHGHKKSDKKKTEDQIKEQNQLSEKINTKLAQFFAIRKQPINEAKIPSLMEFTTILMQLCPDITTIFNYRRELVNKIIELQDPREKGKTLGGEIKLITKIIQGDPKSYTLWSYRQWLVIKFYEIDPTIIDKEKQLCGMLLMKDEKNFHVWNYRNWANTIKMNVDFQLEFTKIKINSNPFNFSPYHFRSKYLIWKYHQEFDKMEGKDKQQVIAYGMPKSVFDSELETVRTAIFLNPKQEAPWLYYSWLLKQILPSFLLSTETQQTQKGLSYSLTFSLKIKNLIDAIEASQDNKMEITSQTSPSNKWKIEVSQKSEIIKRIDLKKVRIQNESCGRRLIWDQNEDITEIKSIYQAQEKFIREVVQSQENQCRFAWLQILELYKCMLYLGVSFQLWKEITAKAQQAFLYLGKQSKGHKYIEKQKIQWERLSGEASLSQLEDKLRSYRKE